MYRETIRNALVCFLASITAFIVTPVFMIGSSPEDYSFITFEAFIRSGVLFSSLYFFVIFSIGIVFNLFKMEKAASLFSSFNLYWIVSAGLLFPLSASTGMVAPESNPVNILNILWVVILVFTLCMLTMTKFKKYVYVFTIILIVNTFVSSAASIYNSGIISTASNDIHPSLKLSKNKNILVISFDGMPGELISKIIKENDRYSNTLKDFVVFENAVSQSPATTASLMGDIYGVIDYKSKGETTSQAKKVITSEGVNEALIMTHISDTYQFGYSGFEIEQMEIPSPEAEAQSVDSATLDLFKYPTIRLWTSKSLRFYWGETIQKTINDIILPEATNSFAKKLRYHKGKHWDKKNIMSLAKFNSFTSNIKTNDKDISLRYMHLTFTHFPVDFDDKCNYRSDDKLWHNTNQNEAGIKTELICAIDVFINFIGKLQKLDIYDNSLVIFKSDHGKPVNYFSAPPNNFKINSNKSWGYNRYRPTLMVKGIGVVNDNIIFRPELVLLNDIARTTCESSTLNIECNNIEGVNLLGEKLDNGKPYYLYVPKDKQSNFKYDSHISVKIATREHSLLEAMEFSPSITLSTPSNPGKIIKPFSKEEI